MQGELSGEKVIVTGSEANILGKGYGRKKGRLELSLEEAAFLLETSKIEIKGEEEKELNLEDFLKHALGISPKFGVRYIVYKDLKERGYVVQPGGVDFWLYPRGAKPGEKPARYFIRILSERDFFPLKELDTLLISARNMRKEPILAIVDEESDITYYEVKEARFEFVEREKERKEEKAKATLLGDRVLLWNTDLAENLYRNNFYGKLTKEKRLLLSLVEAAYLMKRGQLEIELNAQQPPKPLNFEQFIDYASSIESDFVDKYAVYGDLRGKGLIVKTGFKFGSHFRVYKAKQQKHSSYLIHVLPGEHVFSMSDLSRAVRLAHGVKKRMIFSFKEKVGEESFIRYVDVGRMKL
jgi:tRNA-intron endonuclease